MRINGRYSLRSRAIKQLDHQITPRHFTTFDGHKLPIRGPFTQAVCQHGTAVLYVSQPGEVPLYYSTTPGWIHWHEQKLALPGSPQRLNQGEALIWTPHSLRVQRVDELPQPEIRHPMPIDQAVEEYKSQILNAVSARLDDSTAPVAVSQSGGIDSLMVAWALLQLGRKFVPMTVCTGMDDPDISVAMDALSQMNAPEPIPIVIQAQKVESLLKEALLCFEDVSDGNIKMAIGNLLMARKCQELGIQYIFNGHAQDDLQGVGGLAIGNFRKKVHGTTSERWRDTRRKETQDATGMVKMFSATFRRYGIQVRMPFYDADLLEWAFAQPIEVIPVHHAKPFARSVACSILPPGPWQNPKYNSTGYITGAGFYEDRLRDLVESKLKHSRAFLHDLKNLGWSKIAILHASVEFPQID